MVSENIKITNEYGIHARTAAILSAECNAYISKVRIRVDEKTLNPKNVMELMLGRISCGKEITVICDGMDEEQALKGIIEVIYKL